MFTGLIEATGRIGRVTDASERRVLWIETDLGAEVRAGDSVAVSGVCLTATGADRAGFSAEVSPETLRVTILGRLVAGDAVNLERPVRADARLGGHFVQGHVDAVGQIAALRADGECQWLDIGFPPPLARWLVSKGSVAVDGISLTVASLEADRFGVQIIPFTWDHTTLRFRREGDQVNLEADIIGKYVARLFDTYATSSPRQG